MERQMKLKLAEYRDRARLTQSQVAEIAGVSSKTEWNWEQGKSFPNAAQLLSMCVAFNCTPNDLMGWYDTHPREDTSLSKSEAIVISDYRESTPDGRRDIEKYARERRDLADLSRQDGESYEEMAV